MDRKALKEQFKEAGLLILGIDFFEEGYEIRFVASDGGVDLDTAINSVEKEISSNYAVVNECRKNKVNSMLVVPKTIEEMTDYIWKYVAQYTKGGLLSENMSEIGDAFCALERSLEDISDEKQRKEAKTNYEVFSKMVF